MKIFHRMKNRELDIIQCSQYSPEEIQIYYRDQSFIPLILMRYVKSI